MVIETGGNFSYMNTIGTRIQQRRENLNLSTRQLAAAVGISNAAVTKLEKDQSKSPSAENLFRLAVALKTDPQYLLYGEQRFKFVLESAREQPVEKWPLSVPLRQIEALTDRDRSQLDRIVEAFVAGCHPDEARNERRKAS
ncbi:helix-turn-helix domain-containing protein [Paraburkholderia dipogonis]|uniref:helix-turn-helix domain-containing protein n=1 Tax=Paraburkholderia dipogonis TaxID=1211383 RepID=UPI0038B72991